MEEKDEFNTWQDILYKVGQSNSELAGIISEQYSKITGAKPIHFKNPEKLNGEYHKAGRAFEITFIGRDLSLSEDNWTWILTETEKPNAEHKFTVLKYPKTNGYANIIKVGYGVSTKKEVLRNQLDSINFMLNEIQSLTDLPF